MNHDWIAVIESAYRLDRDDTAWLQSLLTQARPLIDQGLPPVAWIYRHSPNRRHLTFADGAAPEYRRWVKLAHAGRDPRLYELLYGQGRCLGTIVRDMFTVLPDEEQKFRTVTAGRAADLLLAAGHTGTGDAIAFAAYSRKQIVVPRQHPRRWRQLGAHLGAGLRLRSAVSALCLEEHPVEAVCDPDGRLRDARNDGRERNAREQLRHAVRLMDRVRCRSRRLRADDALAEWEALVAGRWSLIEHFDSDDRRFIVAVRNDPQYADPRGLTQRERQVAEYVGMGRSSSEIAYTLGLAPSSVTDCSLRAQRKLGLDSWRELATFFARNGPRARLARFAVRDQQLLIGSYPRIPEHALQGLTPAERDVLAALLAGSTQADIAARRGSSERTIANQVQSIYRKLGVRSRNELAAELYSSSGSSPSESSSDRDRLDTPD
ncbi:MAG: helix-turn-helix transcriptional regulator [Chromatiales bacterium]